MALMYKMTLLINGKEKVICNTTKERFDKNLEVAKAKVYKVLKKTKLYPVGRWETYKHVFYNANDRAWNNLYDARENGNIEDIEKATEWLDKVQDMLGKFDCGPRDGSCMVYMEYKDYKVAKDIIRGYAWRHNGTV